MQRRQWFSCFNASFEMGSLALHYIFIRPSHTLPKCHVTKALKKACLCNSIASPVLHATRSGMTATISEFQLGLKLWIPPAFSEGLSPSSNQASSVLLAQVSLEICLSDDNTFPTWLWGKILTSGNLQMRSNEKDLNVFYQAMALLVAWIVCYWKVMLANLASPAALSLSMVCPKRGTRFSRGSCIGLGILYTF